MRSTCWLLFWEPADPFQGVGIQFQPVWRCPASLLPSMLTQQRFLYSLASRICLAWQRWSPFPSLSATQDQNKFWIAKPISSVRLKNPAGQEATMCHFLLVSVLTQGFGQEHEKITWHCSSRKVFHMEDVCLSHQHTGLFWRLAYSPRVNPVGNRATVPMLHPRCSQPCSWALKQ